MCTIWAVPLYYQIRPTFEKTQTFIEEKILSNKKNIVIGGTSLLVEVADTQEERTQGLSGKEQLSEKSGMLFVFDEPDKYGFWMKDMKFAIDIIWFNKYGEIIYVVEDARPESYPTTFLPPTASLFVLEVPTGFVKKEGLKIGDKIDLY